MWKWMILLALIIAGSILVAMYMQLVELKQDPGKIQPRTQTTDKIQLRHSYESGVHRYRGQIVLDHSCYRIDTSVTRDHRTPNIVTINLKTIDMTISESVCALLKTPYVFDAVVNEPDDTAQLFLKLVVDGIEREYLLIESSWTDPANTVIVPVQPFVN